ncbi:hypothetical protein BUALT_Bualt04G0132900 [Buddleja alternifolia]|uniref:Uncharacterized protein n=1 Tax=Buddleja alternifolia TaxID=168488 RepID=A0AAV6XV23_9LAMI|nr:hypothetical protein BUALT_Bualt04G0132900 [Buddleja alternifolia]
MNTVVKVILAIITAFLLLKFGSACSNGSCKVGDKCSRDGDCGVGLYCLSCGAALDGSRCFNYSSLPRFGDFSPALQNRTYSKTIDDVAMADKFLCFECGVNRLGKYIFSRSTPGQVEKHYMSIHPKMADGKSRAKDKVTKCHRCCNFFWTELGTFDEHPCPMKGFRSVAHMREVYGKLERENRKKK